MATTKRTTAPTRSRAKSRKATKKATAARRKPASPAKKPKSSHRSAGTVRERVRALTLRTLRDRDLKLREIPELAQQFVEGMATGLNRAVPTSSRNVLRQVVDGLTDAAETTVRSTKSVVSATRAQGANLKQEAARTVKDLRGLEGDFIAALSRAGKKLDGAAREDMELIVQRARRTGTRIKPAAQRVLNAADGRLMELGKETAGASGRAARSAARTVIDGLAGLLQGLGELLEEKPAGKRRKSVRRS